MFVKCAECGYLTPENASLCKQCGAVVGAAAESVAAAPVDAVEPPKAPLSTEAEDWLAATSVMPPPDASTAAPAPPSPPPLQATLPAAPSMFPTATDRPPRRSVPTWTVASGTLLVVAALIVGLMITNSGGDNGTAQKRAEKAQTALTVQQSQIDIAEESLITIPDLGKRWTDLGTSGFTTKDLEWNEPCSDDPALDTTAKFGRSRDFSYDLSSDNTEHGHLSSSVYKYATAADARVSYVARQQPDFAACIDQFNTEYLASPRTTDILGDAVTQTKTSDAVIYHETMHFVHEGTAGTMEFWTAYYIHGAYRGTLKFSGSFQQVYADELVNVSNQRLDVHTPRN